MARGLGAQAFGRAGWLGRFLTFRDNLDFAAEIGVNAIVEPGGSVRTGEITEVAAELGMVHVKTGMRLFHH